MGGKRRCLVIGGGFSGLLTARDLSDQFDVTVVDAKEFFEYTPGILRAYVKPAHFDALSFKLDPVLKGMNVRFLWGEVKSVDGTEQTATIKCMHSKETEKLSWDYCVVAAGCNFNFLHPKGESLWFPTILEDSQPVSAWKHLDERFIEGRRRHLLEEYNKLKALNAQQNPSVLVCGAGFIGVEWATELQYFFPNLKVTIIDFLPNCLGPLPKKAQEYCDKYMQKVGIKTVYGIKYDPKSKEFWQKVGLPNGADEIYICMGVKASNYFMPKETLSDKGPGGGGWIHINKKLQVTTKTGEVYGNGNMYAIGDCNFGCVGGPDDWKKGEGMPPIPKISYPSEEQAIHAIRNIRITDKNAHGASDRMFDCCLPKELQDTWWPWGAGMFATSLGPHDACFVLAANEKPGSGYLSLWGWCSAVQKEIIEASKVDECKDGLIGICIWHFVHHTPVHLFGKGSIWK